MKRMCRSWMLISALTAIFEFANAAEPQRLPQELLDHGWAELFDGKTLSGWQPTGDAEWIVADGAIVTKGDKPGWLMTSGEWANFELHVEFKARATTNSGVFLRTVLEPTDPTKDCYELNIAPRDNPFPTGSLVGRLKTPILLAVGDGAWHAFDVTADGGKVSIYCDGKLVLGYDDPAPLRGGHIGLQSKQGEVAFRNIRIREIRDE